MKYTKALDDLDRRTGKVHTISDWAALGEKPPEAISDDDLIVIENFEGPASAERARQHRQKAIYGDGYPAPALPPFAAPNISDLADCIVEHTKCVIDGPLVKDRFETLEARIRQLESRPLQKWAGVFVEGAQYSEASLATHKGGLWCATATTRTVPGSPGSDWRLIVKKGHV